MSSMISNLMYGEGAKLLQELLNQPLEYFPPKQKIRRKSSLSRRDSTPTRLEKSPHDVNNETGSVIAASFDPRLYAMKLEMYIRNSKQASKMITSKLNSVRQTFEKLVNEHRDRFEMVYALEEERQASTIVRRSTYNLNSKITFPVRNLVTSDKK